MTYSFLQMDEMNARTILGWRYDPPYTLYNVAPEDVDAALPGLLDPNWAYFSMHDERGELVGFCCFGEDARVPGGDYGTPALDIGWGMRPDLTGQSHGAAFLEAILDFARRTYTAEFVRTTVAAFNARSRRLCENLLFRHVQNFVHSGTGTEFVILVRSARVS